uniref:Uncharacterized protein n=1 Tax=Anopheles epiroticus TaxID=199890 RepID=A0A182PWL9_9DIPT
MYAQMAFIRGEILTSLWQNGNATLMRLEALTGPQLKAYATAECTLLKVHEGTASSSFDATLSAGPSRSDHLSRIELPKFNGSPSEWPAFAGRFEKRVACLKDDADKCAFLLKYIECCNIARNSYEAFDTASANGLMKIIDTSIASAKRIAGKTEKAPTVVVDGLISSIILGKLDDDTKKQI